MNLTLQAQAYHVIANDDEAFEVCEYLSQETLLAIDSETYGNGKPCAPATFEKGKAFTDPYSNNVRLVQIRSRDSEAFIFDLHLLSEDGRSAIANLLEQEHITWIGHNLKFDWRMFAVNLNARMVKVYDTMVAATCIGFAIGDAASKSRGNRLKDVVRDYLDQYMDKTEQASNWGAIALTPQQLQYAADDLLHLFDLYDVLTETVDTEFGMAGGVGLEMDCLPVICDMELNGIHLDDEMYRIVQESAKAYLPELEEKLCAFIGWEMIACPPIERARTGRIRKPRPYAIDGDSKSPLDSGPFMLKAFKAKGINVENLQGEHLEGFHEAHPILKDFALYKDLSKQLTMNYADWVNPNTGRIHPTFNQLGAGTGRFACYDPNLQQTPKMDIEVPAWLVAKYPEKLAPYLNKKTGNHLVNYRYCFVVPDGFEMASGDYSGQEVRVMVALSNDPNMVAIHWQPEEVEDPAQPGSNVMIANMAADIHAMTAELVWGVSHGVTCWNAKKMPFPGAPGKGFRDIAKTVTFGLAYGKSAVGLAQQLGITEEEAEAIIKAYFGPYPILKQWLDERGKEAAETRIIQYGVPAVGITRWRMVNAVGSDSGALKRAGMNTPIQACSALMMKLALVLIDKKLKHLYSQGVAIIATIHDEVLVRFPATLRQEVRDIIEAGMLEAGNLFLQGIVPAKVGIGVSTHWTKD